ncbi:unnamed protein product [Gadus morhua 'NCC']
MRDRQTADSSIVPLSLVTQMRSALPLRVPVRAAAAPSYWCGHSPAVHRGLSDGELAAEGSGAVGCGGALGRPFSTARRWKSLSTPRLNPPPPPDPVSDIYPVGRPPGAARPSVAPVRRGGEQSSQNPRWNVVNMGLPTSTAGLWGGA